MQQQLAFKNKDSLKKQVISRMKQHIKLDQLVQGTGYESATGKGCAVGCSIDCYDHQSFADTLGVDLWIPQIYDSLHEGISNKNIAKFNIDFLKSIQVGMTKKQSDLIRLQLFYFMLTEIIPSKFQKYKEIEAIIKLFKLSIEGVTVTKKQWMQVANNIPEKYQFRYVAVFAYKSESASAFAYTAASTAASASAYASTFTLTSASASTAASASAYVYASKSKLKQEAMLKIGYKLIDLFNKVKI